MDGAGSRDRRNRRRRRSAFPHSCVAAKKSGPFDRAFRASFDGIADAMIHDLELSGWFRVLDRSAYIENAQSGITLGTFDLKDWSTIGAEGLVKGGFSVQGDDITVELRLFDVYQSKERIGKRYTGRVRDFRRIAHKFVDEVINQFTGIPGIFNTRIAYVSNSGGGSKKSMFHTWTAAKSSKLPTTTQSTSHRHGVRTADPSSIPRSKTAAKPYFCLSYSVARKLSSRRGEGEISGGKITPDGQSIPRVETGGNTNLYLLDRSGNMIRRLTQDAGIETRRPGPPTASKLYTFRIAAARRRSILWTWPAAKTAGLLTAATTTLHPNGPLAAIGLSTPDVSVIALRYLRFLPMAVIRVN